MAYIELQNVVKKFGDNTVLDHINASIEKGDLVTLLGPSGCGKSTLLRCLAGLEDVTEGRIILDGQDVTDVPASRRKIGMVFQNYSLFPNMNVEQNIAFGLKMKKTPKDVMKKKVEDAIRLVDLTGKEKSYPASLSGGQQQRVALARAIVMEPKVLLLDEPLSAIDAKLRKELQIRIRQIHEELGLTTIFVTHDQDEAMVMSDVIKLFHDGRIEQSGTPVNVYTSPVSTFAAGFIGSYNQVTASDYNRLFAPDAPSKQTIVIRPETIAIETSPRDPDNEYVLQGTIMGNTPRGNVLRYEVKIDENVKLRVDTLFRSYHLYDNGKLVYLYVPKHDCLPVPDSIEGA
ncbi:MAG: ABC transporter ATP-binding protein [Eubacterium sp.]